MSYRLVRVEMYAKVLIDEDEIAQALEDKMAYGEKVETEEEAIFQLTAEAISLGSYDIKDWTHTVG